jgi:hypothetical protein
LPLRDPPHALRRIVSRRVDEPGDLVGFQVLGGKGNEEAAEFSLARSRIEPPVAGARRQDDWHAIMDRCHELVRWTGRDGAGRRAAPDFAASQGPDAGEGERAARAEVDEEWRFPASVFPPLVETIGDDEAAMTSESVSEHRRCREGLGAGVDRSELGILCGFGNESPSHWPEALLVAYGDDGSDQLAPCNVAPGSEIDVHEAASIWGRSSWRGVMNRGIIVMAEGTDCLGDAQG